MLDGSTWENRPRAAVTCSETVHRGQPLPAWYLGVSLAMLGQVIDSG